MDPLRLGFVGVGNMGQCAHLCHYAGMKDVAVVAVADLRMDLAEAVAARYGVPRAYPDHRALLAGERLDAVVCIQPFDRHGQLLPDLYAAGVPILTEKPLGHSVAVGEALLAALQKSKGSHYVAYHKRSDPAVMWARRQMDQWRASSAAGALRYVRVTMPPGDWAADGFRALIRSAQRGPDLPRDPAPVDLAPDQFHHYVALVNYYIHQVNLLHHLLGAYDVQYADPAGRVAVVRSAEGVTATLEMDPYHTTRDWQESVLIAFERGWIRVDLPAPLVLDRAGQVTVFHDPGGGREPGTTVPVLLPRCAMQQQALHFVAAVRGEPTPLCTAGEALADLVTMRRYLDRYLAAGGTCPSKG